MMILFYLLIHLKLNAVSINEVLKYALKTIFFVGVKMVKITNVEMLMCECLTTGATAESLHFAEVWLEIQLL